MSKRRLTEKQKRQIASNKARKREQHALNPEETHNGTVITHHGKTMLVKSRQGEVVQCKLRQNLGTIVCGDRVIYCDDRDADGNNQGVIVAVSDRENLLQKTGFGGKPRAVASNIEQVVVVCSLVPRPNQYLVDRYLVAVENLPATPLVLINKIDLMDDENEHIVNDINALYGGIGYSVLETSAQTAIGMDELQQALAGRTSILVGLSGVGKSSLVKLLLPDIDIRIGEVSGASSEGRHTTTVSTLYQLPSGGCLIDSPGVRDFSPVDLDRHAIETGFREFARFRGHCKFGNCTHSNEPGCAIVQAMEKGEVSEQRVESFRKMLRDSEL
jgi:ribosome biogenesis GTPase